MKAALKAELWKSKHNPYFWLSVWIGIFIALLHTTETIPMVEDARINNMFFQYAIGIPGFGNPDPCSLFIYWMPFTGYTYGSFLFYEIWPLLAAMPFAWSYSQERYRSYYLQPISRVGKSGWFQAKFLAVFISGGIITAVPLVISLFAQAVFAPAILIQYQMMQVIGITNADFLASVYYTRPWIYCICWCGVQFLLGGAAAVSVFLFGSRLRLAALAILLPYGLFYCLAALGTVLRSFVNASFVTNVLHLAMAVPLAHNPGWLIFSFVGFTTGISYLTGYHQVMRHDLF